jgi:hypothetical protein
MTALSGLVVCVRVVFDRRDGGLLGKLSRREAQHQIDEILKPHATGPNRVMVAGTLPGYEQAARIAIGPERHDGEHPFVKQPALLPLQTGVCPPLLPPVFRW